MAKGFIKTLVTKFRNAPTIGKTVVIPVMLKNERFKYIEIEHTYLASASDRAIALNIKSQLRGE